MIDVVIDGYEWVVLNIINMFGWVVKFVIFMFIGGGFFWVFNIFIENVYCVGVLIIVVVGNSGVDVSKYFFVVVFNVIIVGIIDKDNIWVFFFNYGFFVDIFVVGVSVCSIWIGSIGVFVWMSGMSMVCFYVVGLVLYLMGLGNEIFNFF